MADTLVGFGLGLTGTPKDYTSIVAARERQKAADEAAAKKQKLQQYQDIAKSVVIDKALPYQKDDYIIKIGETLDKVKKSIDNGDYNSQIMAMNEFNQYAKERRAEYDAVENYRTLMNKGSINPDSKVAPDEFWNAKNRQEIIDKSGGDFVYNPQTGTLNVYPTNKYNVVESWKQAGDKIPIADASQWEYVSIPGAGGKKVILYAPNEEKYKSRLAMEFDYNIDAQRNAIVNYKRQNNLLGVDYQQGTPEFDDLIKKSKEQYIKDGYEWGLQNKSQIVGPPGKGISVKTYVSMGAEKGKEFGDWTQQPLEFNFKNAAGESTMGRYEDSWGMSLTKSDVSMPNTTGYYDLNSGDKIPFTVGDDIKFQGAYVLPVYKNDSTITTGTYAKKRGEIVLPYNLEKEAKKGNVEYKLIAVGQGKIMPVSGEGVIEKQVKVYRPWNEVMNAFEGTLSEAEKKDWRYNKFPRATEIINEKNKELRDMYEGGGSRSTPPTEGGGGGGKKKPNKHGI